MAQIVLDIPDDTYERVIVAFRDQFGYAPYPGQRDEGISREQFVVKMLLAYIGKITLTTEANSAAKAARVAVLTKADDPLVTIERRVHEVREQPVEIAEPVLDIGVTGPVKGR